MADAGSAIRFLRSKDFVNGNVIATLGFCMGGRAAVLIAARYAQFVSAAVSFYGGGLAGENTRPGRTLNPMEEAAKLRGPLLLFYGGKDKNILPEHVEQFTARLREAGKSFQSKVYPEADHGFNCNDRPSYNAEAARDAWRKTLDFLGTNLKKA